MVTSQLNWRFIRPTHPASTASVNVLATMKGQIIQSSSYWRIVESAATGSTSLVLTQVSQDFKPMYIVLTNNITGTTAYRTPDTNAVAASSLQIGLAVGSGTFVNAQSETPFGPDVRWWRYWNVGLLANVSQSYFIEGEDVLAIGLRSSAANTQFLAVAGALCETNDLSIAEDADGRVCGISTTGTAGLAAAGWSSATVFPGYSNIANSTHTGIFGISGSVTNDVIPIRRQTFANASTGLLLISGSTAGARIGIPLQMFALSPSTKDYMVGKLRNMYATANSVHLVTFSSGASDVAVVVGHSNTTAGNVMMFAPLSGTQLNYV